MENKKYYSLNNSAVQKNIESGDIDNPNTHIYMYTRPLTLLAW